MPALAYVIGDIHGCYNELLELEAAINRHAARHGRAAFIVSCGDLIDRGPASGAVVRRFRVGAEAGTHAAILGNHEVMCLQTLECAHPDLFDGSRGRLLPPGIKTHAQIYQLQKSAFARSLNWEDYAITQRGLWLGQGGGETLVSFGLDPRDLTSWRQFDGDDLAFLASLPPLWEDAYAVVSHAFATAEQLQMLRMAKASGDYDAEGYDQALWAVLTSRKPPTSRPDPTRTHLSGHTPLERIRRTRKLGVTQIDTGCCYGRSLTAYCTETGEALSVKVQASS